MNKLITTLFRFIPVTLYLLDYNKWDALEKLDANHIFSESNIHSDYFFYFEAADAQVW